MNMLNHFFSQLHIKLNELVDFGADNRPRFSFCQCAFVERRESPLLKLDAQTKTPLPLVQMSKAFMKIPDVIQLDPTNKALLCCTQTQ